MKNFLILIYNTAKKIGEIITPIFGSDFNMETVPDLCTVRVDEYNDFWDDIRRRSAHAATQG